MKKVLSFCVLAGALTISTAANAALIVDTNNDSFIDTSTGLEWMDFGITNNQSFDYVSSQLVVGGVYEGWRLPNVEEVLAMWWNIGDLDNYTPDYSFTDSRIDRRYFAADDLNNDTNTESAFDQVFSIIGYNKVQPYGSTGEKFTSYGFFEGTDSLSWLRYENYTMHPGVPDRIIYRDDQNINSERSTTNELYSTLLVKADSSSSTEVSEPSSLAVFGLAGLLLAGRRFSRK